MHNMNRFSCKKQNHSLLPSTTWFVTRHVLFMGCKMSASLFLACSRHSDRRVQAKLTWDGQGGRGEARERKGRRRRRFPCYRASLPLFFPHFPRVQFNSLPTIWMPPLCFESVEQATLFTSSFMFLLPILPCVYNLGYHYTEDVLFQCSFAIAILHVLSTTGKNNRFPLLDILGYLKNTHKNPKFGRVRQVPIRELGWEFSGWDLSHFAKIGIFMGIL